MSWCIYDNDIQKYTIRVYTTSALFHAIIVQYDEYAEIKIMNINDDFDDGLQLHFDMINNKINSQK